ncbi:hypothetical protein GWI36_05385 [Psychrilyobacter sp. BL5]|nr:hypothetical protein [Psychrilyobacter sp. S5]NDI77329.1 hypothetical protein [Psychrilyobacter piezotolerans]
MFKITKVDWNKVKDILEHKEYKDKKYEIIVDDLEDNIKGLEFTEINLYTNYSQFIISEETEDEVIDLIEELENRTLQKNMKN